jgi:hypothetical protein
MKPLRHFLFFSAITTLFVSCKKDNELQLNAPYKEIPSVYAVLSPQENVHIIRVNKVFLGEGDANVMAKVADSVNYPAGELTITLDRFEPGSKYYRQINACPTCPQDRKKTIVFHDSIIQTGQGSFNTTQRVYVSYDNLRDVDKTISGEYLLTVKNNHTGNIFTAKSTIVDSVGPSGYRPLAYPYYPYNPGTSPTEYVDYGNVGTGYSVRFKPVSNAQIYQVVIRMYFKDYVGSGEAYRVVDYSGNTIDATRDKKTDATGSYLLTEFKGADIFTAAAAGLKSQGLDDQVNGRKMYMIEYDIYASTQDYADYMEFVKPSFSITQSRPLYSNFQDRAALGIFTFRSKGAIRKEMSTSFINSFSDNPSTCQYKFLTVDNQYRGCK